MTIRSHILIAFVVVLAVGLTLFKIPLASSQGLTLIAAKVTDDLPATDAASALWQKATAIEVPLSAQSVVRPLWPEAKVKSVVVRALYNEAQLAFLIEWADETQNDSMVRIQDFRDAVALQFPLAEGPPFYCMGQQGGNVNIWHWKADWQADITARQDVDKLYPNMYVDGYTFTKEVTNISAGPGDYSDPNYLPALASNNLFASATHASPVEDIVAGGFSSLTTQPSTEQNVQGYGAWADGKWRVIFSRNLASAETDDVTFKLDQLYSVAFAAWDGANGERNGQKSTSQWVALQFEGASSAPAAQAQTTAAPESAAVAKPAAAPESAAPTVVGPSSELNVTGIMMLSLVGIVLGGLVLISVLMLLSKLSGQK